MKSSNAVITISVALLVAIGVALGVALEVPNSSEVRLVSATTELKPGQRKLVVIAPQAFEVRLFVEGMSRPNPKRVVELMKDRDGILLTAKQRARLDRSMVRHRMTRAEYENHATAGCFIPHHFFRYYDAAGKQMGELAVCYCCGGVAVSSTDPPLGDDEGWVFDHAGIKQMLKDMNVPVDIDCPTASSPD